MIACRVEYAELTGIVGAGGANESRRLPYISSERDRAEAGQGLPPLPSAGPY
jgi:hypothetical protein